MGAGVGLGVGVGLVASVDVFSLMVKVSFVGCSVIDGFPMNNSSSILQFHFSSSPMVAFNKVTEHSLKDPLHSIPLSQLDSTYQFKEKLKPTFMCKQ